MGARTVNLVAGCRQRLIELLLAHVRMKIGQKRSAGPPSDGGFHHAHPER